MRRGGAVLPRCGGLGWESGGSGGSGDVDVVVYLCVRRVCGD
jgi:hypothetical protein